MNRLKLPLLYVTFAPAILLFMRNDVHATERADIIVAHDGSGRFRLIQDAINSVPQDNASNITILIKKGTYAEKLLVTKSQITLVGEDRDSTRIVYAELRSNWVKAHDGDDWGSAVINIGDGVTDVVLANLTVYNNYGSLYGSHDHQFAIRGFQANRIALLHCNVIADGGDTVSLWNGDSGMYYHASCYFEGWVDYVCPRGWCYVTDSRFFGHNLPSASIWHDGSKNKEQKFVIRNSSFDGVPDFPLGRHHRDGQFYLLDCTFSKNMADRPIYYPKQSPNAVPWIWGERHYFYNCHREGGDYSWFANNLEKAEGPPKQEEVTSKWTFGGRWDPEASLPPVLPFASIPTPRNDDYGVDNSGMNLRWISARNAVKHLVHFGETNPPPVVASTTSSSFRIEVLKPSTEYYWSVDVVTDADTIAGQVWRFRTVSNENGTASKGKSP
jgi:pectinesterase